MQIPKNLFKKKMDRALQTYLKDLLDPENMGKSVYPTSPNCAVTTEVVKRASDVLLLMGVPHRNWTTGLFIESV